MQVNYNISAMIANNALISNDNKLAESIERLSSGLKIANAKDNPSGLAMSRRMNAQIRGLKQASNNSGDGISIMSTADGALTEVHDILQRMSELAIQATNGTNSNNDRRTIQDEIDQLKDEITRIAETTQFNGQNLLDGSFDLRGYATTGDATLGENVTNPNVTINEYGDMVEAGHYVVEGITARFNERIGELDIKDMGSEYIKIYQYDPITKTIDRENPYMANAKMTTDGDLLRMETRDGKYIELRITETLDNATINFELTGKGAMTLQIGANEGVTLDARIPTISLDNLGLVYTDFTRTIVDDVYANVQDLNTGDISGNTPYYDVFLGAKYATDRYHYYENIENNTADFYATQDYIGKMTTYRDFLNEYSEIYGNGFYKDIADDITNMLEGVGTSDLFPGKETGLKNQQIVSSFIEKYYVASSQQAMLDSYDYEEYSDEVAKNIYTILTTDIAGVVPKDDTITKEISPHSFMNLVFEAEEILHEAKPDDPLLLDNIDITEDVTTDAESVVKYFGFTKENIEELFEHKNNGTLTSDVIEDIFMTAKSNFLTQEESNLVKSKESWENYMAYLPYLKEYQALKQADYDNVMAQITDDMSIEAIEVIEKIAEPYKEELEKVNNLINAITDVDAALDGDYNPITDAEKVSKFANLYYIDENTQRELERIMADTSITDLNKGRKLYETLQYSYEKGIGAPNTGADQAIRDISNAIQKLSNIRARLGAYQNRLEHTTKSINVVDENMTAAYSRIMDVDMAEEMTVYSTQQVLSQAGTTMLAQANERPSQVLQLLQ